MPVFASVFHPCSDAHHPRFHSQCQQLEGSTEAATTARQRELELGKFVRIRHWGDSDSIYDGDYTVRYLVHTTIKPGWFQQEKSCFMVAAVAPTLHVSNDGTTFEWDT